MILSGASLVPVLNLHNRVIKDTMGQLTKSEFGGESRSKLSMSGKLNDVFDYAAAM